MAVRAITLGLVALTAAAPMWRATLEPKDGSKVSGTASVEAVGSDSSRVSVQISGAKAGSTLPWHIHNGLCGAKGTIYGDAAAYPALKAGTDGSASGSVTLPGAPPSAGEYSVSVHRSATDMTPIACGSLKSDKPAMMSMPHDSMMRMSHDSMMPMPKDTTYKP